jgi:hypothetical protein
LPYITLDTFTAGALVVAQAQLLGSNPEITAKNLASQYQASYNDHNLDADFIGAKNEIIQWLEIRFPHEGSLSNLASACETLALAISKFEQNGKKRRRFFNGTIFRKNQDRITQKASRSLEMVILYDTMIGNGIIQYSRIR